jgi:hypothetical protein
MERDGRMWKDVEGLKCDKNVSFGSVGSMRKIEM